jgi:formate dehydrogenase subunit gamma
MTERGTNHPLPEHGAPRRRGRGGDDLAPAEPASPEAQRIRDAVEQALAQHGAEAGGLLEVLHAIQGALGHVPPEHVDTLARALNLSRAEVHGVISFYHDFRTSPPGRHVVKVCRAEACQAVGGGELAASISKQLGVGYGETRADGVITLESVYCLGNCACAPALTVNGRMFGRMSEERLEVVLAAVGGDGGEGTIGGGGET